MKTLLQIQMNYVREYTPTCRFSTTEIIEQSAFFR